MPDFLLIYRYTAADEKAHMGSPEAAQQAMKLWMSWLGELEMKGKLKSAGEPLETTGKVVRGTKKQVTDGPYAEMKDLVSGFSILTATDAAEAAELAKGCPVLGFDTGSVEVRPILKLG